MVNSSESEASPLGTGLPSKKDVKAVLAQRAMVLLEGLSRSPKAPVASTVSSIMNPANDSDGINWVGRILGKKLTRLLWLSS